MVPLRKKRVVLAALTAAALLLTACAFFLSRERRFEDRWAKVRFGMSKDEVRQILGEPDGIYPANESHSNTALVTLFFNFLMDSTYERWAYGPRRLIAFEPTFPYFSLAFDGFLGPENQDYVIYFHDDGSVLKKRLPKYRAEGAR